MRDYFKARLGWGAGLDALSDAQAGRLCKALWAYAGRGETNRLDGAEGALLSVFVTELRQDSEHFEKVSRARSKAGTASAMARQTNANKTEQQEHVLTKGTYVDKANKPERNEHMLAYVQKEEAQPRSREVGGGFLTEDEADSLAIALQEVYDAAERAGFPNNPATMDKLTELSASFSPARVIAALDIATERGKTSIGYLRGILSRENAEPEAAPQDLPIVSFDSAEGEPEGVSVAGMPNIRLV